LEFPGEGYINLGISRGGGGLTLEFPGKGAFRIWNSKGRSNSHIYGISRGRGKFHGMEIPWEDIC
jgi:hypothetical protein